MNIKKIFKWIFITILTFVILPIIIFLGYFYPLASNKYKGSGEYYVVINDTKLPGELASFVGEDNDYLLKNIYIESYQGKEYLLAEAFLIELGKKLKNRELLEKVSSQGLGQIQIPYFINIINKLDKSFIETSLKDLVSNPNAKKLLEYKSHPNFKFDVNNDEHFFFISDFLNDLEMTSFAIYIFMNNNIEAVNNFHKDLLQDSFNLNLNGFSISNMYQSGIPKSYIAAIQFMIYDLGGTEQVIDGEKSSINPEIIRKILTENGIIYENTDYNKLDLKDLFLSKNIQALAKITKRKTGKKPDLLLLKEDCEKVEIFLCHRGELIEDLEIRYYVPKTDSYYDSKEEVKF